MDLKQRFTLISRLRDKYAGDTVPINIIEHLDMNEKLYASKDVSAMSNKLANKNRSKKNLKEIEDILNRGFDLARFMTITVVHGEFTKYGSSANAIAFLILNTFWEHLTDEEKLVVPLVVETNLSNFSKNNSDGVSLHTILEAVHFLGFKDNDMRLRKIADEHVSYSKNSLRNELFSSLQYFRFNEFRPLEKLLTDQPRKAIDEGTDPLYAFFAYSQDEDVRKSILHMDTEFVLKTGINGAVFLNKANIEQAAVESWVNAGVDVMVAIEMHRAGVEPYKGAGQIPNEWARGWVGK